MCFPFSIHSILWHCVSFWVTASNPIQSETNDIGDMSAERLLLLLLLRKRFKQIFTSDEGGEMSIPASLKLGFRLDSKLIELSAKSACEY